MDLDDFGKPIADPIVKEAYERYQRCEEWEGNCRKRFMDDIKFANADPDNGYQWPLNIRQNRQLDQRPCLTVNIAQAHNRQIINDAKQNKSGIAVRPTGGGATYQSAMAIGGLMRHIEYQSNAQNAYGVATTFQVEGGIGYWRVSTDYANDDTFDQEIYINPCPDPLNIYLDPDIKEKDGSDAKFGFVFDDVLKKDFLSKHKKYKNLLDTGSGDAALGNSSPWSDDDYIKIVEYFRIVETEDRLCQVRLQGQDVMFRESRIGKELFKRYVGMPTARVRDVPQNEVEWYLIVGTKIVEQKPWPGKYIPIVRVIGTETVIEGELDRKGHTRAMKDAQRIYNYWNSSAVEHVALQGKTPWIGAAEAFEGYEAYWKTANTVNHAFLAFNGFLDDGITKIEAPTRAAPPQMAPAYLQGMEVSRNDLMSVTGQYQSQMGMPGNERSGTAINERQRQGDNATYHFIDNLGLAIRLTGKIILDLIPKIYDSRRIQKILADDGTDQDVQLDPTAQQAYAEKMDQEGKIIERILNPAIGYYDVQADIGPAYATRRQETFNALVQIITQAPQLIPIIGDILLDVADFPKADEAARRLKNMVPPEALGNGPSAKEQQMQLVIGQAQQTIKDLMQQASIDQIKLKAKSELRDIDVYEAETKRISALSQMMPEGDPEAVKGFYVMLKDLVADMMRTDLGPVLKANEDDLAAAALDHRANAPKQPTPNMPGARRAADGQLYVPDPQRPGKYIMVQ